MRERTTWGGVWLERECVELLFVDGDGFTDALLGKGREGRLFLEARLLTWFRVRLCGVEPLKGGGGVVLDENHCVAGFVTGCDLDASRFG